MSITSRENSTQEMLYKRVVFSFQVDCLNSIILIIVQSFEFKLNKLKTENIDKRP